MGIIAGFLVQNVLKYLLKFGEASHYLGYNAMQDYFPKMSLKPNKDCDDYHCRKQQKKFAEEEVERLKNQPEIVETPDTTNEIVHEENDWGISLVADDDVPDQSSNQEGSNLAQGLSLAYERRVTMEADVKEVQENLETEQSLEDLMNQMKQL